MQEDAIKLSVPDPNVLIAGSAGGRDVLALLGSPRARGLFHRAIAQSGAVRPGDLEAAEQIVNAAAANAARVPGEFEGAGWLGGVGAGIRGQGSGI